MQREYKNLIFTKHALQRMKLRDIEQDAILQTIKKPDSRENETDGDIKFTRVYHRRDYHVVAYYLKDEKKWLIKTTWVRGEDDPQALWKRLLLAPLRIVTWLIQKVTK